MTPNREVEVARLIQDSRILKLPFDDYRPSRVYVTADGLESPVMGSGPHKIAAFVQALNLITGESLIKLTGRPGVLVDPIKGNVAVTLRMVYGNKTWPVRSEREKADDDNLPQVVEEAGYAAVKKGFLQALLGTQPDSLRGITDDIMRIYN